MEREKQLLQNELDHKDRELAMQAIHANEKDRFLEGLVVRLTDFEKDRSEDGIQRIIKETKSQIASEKSWDSFMMHFEKVHPDFFSRLKTEFAGLTTYDLKLCSYLKIGMGNKEIGNIAGVGESAVKSSLFRLKRKMNLGNGDNLRGFVITY